MERVSFPDRETDERGEYVLQLALRSFLKLKEAKAKMVFLSTFHKGRFVSFLCYLAQGPKNISVFSFGLDKEDIILFNRVANDGRGFFLPGRKN